MRQVASAHAIWQPPAHWRIQITIFVKCLNHECRMLATGRQDAATEKSHHYALTLIQTLLSLFPRISVRCDFDDSFHRAASMTARAASSDSRTSCFHVQPSFVRIALALPLLSIAIACCCVFVMLNIYTYGKYLSTPSANTTDILLTELQSRWFT